MLRRNPLGTIGFILFVSIWNCTTANAAVTLSLQQVATGLSSPLFVTAPAGDSRIFIVEKTGIVRVQSAPNAAATEYLNIGSTGQNLIDTVGERGLLGMAFDPNFSSNFRFYVYYIDRVTLDTKVARFTATNAGSALVTAAPEEILTVTQLAGQSNHKAGWIGFRPGDNNNLYIATGDGGGSNDPGNNAEDLTDNLGKILRIDVSGNGTGYTVPGDNPFVGVAGNDEIWAYGLRNPFRNSFDRTTGDLYIADVGQGAREEVNVEEASQGGRHYGWDDNEGTIDNPNEAANDPTAGKIDPVFDYASSGSSFAPAGAPNGSSITGGYVYRGALIPDINGTYFFADYVNGQIGSFIYDPVTNTVSNITNRTAELLTGTTIGTFDITSFGEGGNGELYVVDFDGQVWLLVPEPASIGLLAMAGLMMIRRRGN